MGDIYTVCRWMRNTSGRDNADVGGMIKMVAQMIETSKIHELITYSAKVCTRLIYLRTCDILGALAPMLLYK